MRHDLRGAQPVVLHDIVVIDSNDFRDDPGEDGEIPA